MQIINIFPLSNMCMELTQPMHMYLTHMVEKYPQYVAAAKAAEGYKILDNSLIELGDAVSIKRVLTAAKTIEANEIILPDVFQDRDGTLRWLEASLTEIDRIYKSEKPFKLMAVAQGKTYSEWDMCYEEIMSIKEIDVIGIPKVCAKMLPGGRPEVMRRSACRLLDKDHHLLGVWYSAEELFRYDHPEMIRSCDTVLASFMAKHNLNPLGVRPDGFTVDLEKDVIDPEKLQSYMSLMFKDGKGGIQYGKH